MSHEVRRWAPSGDEAKLYAAGSGQQLKRHKGGWRGLGLEGVLGALELSTSPA